MLLSRPRDPFRLGTMKPGPLRQPRLFDPVDDDAMEVESIMNGGNRVENRERTGIYFNNQEIGAASAAKCTRTKKINVMAAGTEEVWNWDSSNPLPPKQELQATPMPDIAFSHPTCTPETDVTTLSKALGVWKPFVNRVAKFIEQERFPFEYVDIWIADDAENNQKKNSSSSSSSVVMKHVGHATNSRTEISSIFTMYHMNQFGDDSEKYVFPPGIGLPGRVLVRGEPIWDDHLSNAATYTDFPRTALARKHGVRKGLGIPLVLPDADGTSRQAIIVMYTTQKRNLTPDNQGFLIHMMCQEFQRNKRSLAASSLSSRPALTGCAADESCNRTNKSQLPVLEDDDDDDDDDDNTTYQAILPTDTEVEVARILYEHAESQQHEQSAEDLQTMYALYGLLMRAPCRRTLAENLRVDALTEQFRAQTNSGNEQQNNSNNKDSSLLAEMVLSAWEDLCWEGLSSTLGGGSSGVSGVEIEEIDMEEVGII